jgi:hypothetical protein
MKTQSAASTALVTSDIFVITQFKTCGKAKRLQQAFPKPQLSHGEYSEF